MAGIPGDEHSRQPLSRALDRDVVEGVGQPLPDLVDARPLVLVADLRGAIGFSSFGVLIYYAVANLAALRQPIEQRRSPRLLQLIGLIGCLALVGTLPPASVLAGLAAFAVGIVGRLLLRSENGGGH